jgi:large subunit ribosomal protein L15
MQTHQVKRNTKNKAKRSIGRGGKRGKTSGRGMKGQKSRSGHSIRPEIRDIIKKVPKLRGHRANHHSNIQIKNQPINLSTIEKEFNSGDEINSIILVEKGFVRRTKGKLPVVKVLGTGEITKKIIVNGCLVSESARGKIEKAGGIIKNKVQNSE